MGLNANIHAFIKRAKNLRMLGSSAFCLLILLSLLSIFPIVHHEDQAEAAYVPSVSNITITSASNTASVDITPASNDGTFATSTAASEVAFNVTTNNLTGYNLSINGSDSTGNLTNPIASDTLETITSATDANTFASGSTSTYTNKWGIKPNKLNGTNNTDYLPAPTTTNTITIDNTTASNTEANSYTIGLGARVDYTKPNGTYTNTFTLIAVGNPVIYEIEYQDTTGDSSVTNFPSPNPDSITTAMASYTLSTTTPTRTGYSFAGWCEGTVTHTASGNSTCSGTTYTAGATYTFSSPYPTAGVNTTLKAMWNVNKYTCTKQYRLQNANDNGSYPTTYTPDGTEQVAFGATCTYDKTVTNYNGNNQMTDTCTITTDGCTASLSFPRNTYTLTVSKGSNISSVSGGGTYRWGQSVSISATPTSTYRFSKWTQTAGTTSSFANANSASTTFTMPTSDATVSAAAVAVSFATAYSEAGKSQDSSYYKMQDMTSSICSKVTDGQTATLRDRRTNDNRTYTVAKFLNMCWMTSNLNLPGNITIYNTDSNITASSYKLPASNNGSSSFTEDSSAYVYNSTAYVYNSGSTTCSSSSPCYSYYSYKAATAGTDPSSGDATSDICPKGWRLPTGEEYDTLRLTYKTGPALVVAPFNAVYTGYYRNGSFVDGGTYGQYWSSTAATATVARNFYLNSTNAMTNYRGKNEGRGLRCVAKT